MFSKEYKENQIVFYDLDNDKKIIIEHFENKQCTDILKITKSLSKEFVNYMLEELVKSNDITVCYALYDDIELENILSNYNFKISNYRYRILYKHQFIDNSIKKDDIFNEEAKKYFLDKINKENIENNDYYNDGKSYISIDEKFFDSENHHINIYRKNGKIVGMVDFQLFDNYIPSNDAILDVNNKICIRAIVSNNDKMTENIIKSLLNQYKKDIIISCQYTNCKLKSVIKKFDNKFQYTMFLRK